VSTVGGAGWGVSPANLDGGQLFCFSMGLRLYGDGLGGGLGTGAGGARARETGRSIAAISSSRLRFVGAQEEALAWRLRTELGKGTDSLGRFLTQTFHPSFEGENDRIF